MNKLSDGRDFMLKKKPLIWCLAIIMVLTIFIVFVFTRTKPEPERPPDPAVLNFSSSQLSKYLKDEISRYLPIEQIDVAFFEDGTVELDAVFKKEDVRALLAKKQASLQYAAELLPEQIDTHLSLRLIHKGKSVAIDPISFKVASFDLTSWLSQEVVDSFNRKIARYFSNRKIELRSFRVLPDAISMEIRRNST